jgi:hypothetical protein
MYSVQGDVWQPETGSGQPIFGSIGAILRENGGLARPANRNRIWPGSPDLG